jgi:ribosomal protein L37AE/L43A
MKDNIDLTLNRDFRKNKEVFSISDIMFSTFAKIPWKTMLNSITQLRYDETFFTGNKDIRNQKKKVRTYESEEDTCECCGVKILPWNRVYMLCSKCDKELEEGRYKDRFWFLNINKNKL